MIWVKSPIFIIVATQLLFTTSDLIARANMRTSAFTISTFISWWFLTYFVIRQFAMFGQLYVFSQLQVGKTMALFGATSIVIVNVLGFFVAWRASLTSSLRWRSIGCDGIHRNGL